MTSSNSTETGAPHSADNAQNDTLETAIARASRHGFTVRQQLGGDTEFPFHLISTGLTLNGLAELLDLIDRPQAPSDTAEAARESIRAMRREAEGVQDENVRQAVNQLADEMESELDDEPDFIVPQIVSKRPDQDRWAHDVGMAAIDHAKHLQKAEGRIGKAKGLAETLRCALLSSAYNPEPFADDVVESIISQLSKAQDQIDKHSSEHRNLFLAYFDRDRPES